MVRRSFPLGLLGLLGLLSLLLVAPAALAGGKKAGQKRAGAASGIEWKVVPANVVIFLDGKKLGEAGALGVTSTTPGMHAVKLVKGGDRTETRVKVTKGQVVRFEFDFSDS